MRCRRLALGLGFCLLLGTALCFLWVYVENWLPFSYVPYYLPCPEIFNMQLQYKGEKPFQPVTRSLYPQPKLLEQRPAELLALTPWLAPIVSEGTFNPELLHHIYQPLNLTIGVTVFAVGNHPSGPAGPRPPAQHHPHPEAGPPGGDLHAPDGANQPAHRREGTLGGGLHLLPQCGHGVPEPMGPRDPGGPGGRHSPRLLRCAPPAVPLRAQAYFHRLRGRRRRGLLLRRGGLRGAGGQRVRVYQRLPHGHPGGQGQWHHGRRAGGEPPEPPLPVAQALQSAVP
ncbi:globoside alpha-1,3-N-acetylgalactosaminyltransferase 1 isoform X3 [Mustela lutreola]|uniref:globoside alpha-1,3-N-acetylgalactosaminyltransferase 1 isoform X3 n=1 Tax=Mustela lutreola TaxID=9666 RepID=UPI0027978CDC|nr:globoside alpha-1,3-N-acetylgalactosaminyltransferase 1 isoform X3 [Mustela lutreola]